MLKHKVLRLAVLMLAATGLMALAGCGSSSSTPVAPVVPIDPTVNVTDTAGAVVEGAVVYAIPATDVAELATMPITRGDAASTEGQGNYGVAAQAVDEPLEDIINDNFTPTSGGVTTYVTATTDATGTAVLTGLPVTATDMFFIYVAPAATDSAHLPGGSMSRNAVSGASLDNMVTAVELSTNPSASATYIGSSACLNCHATKDLVKQTAHKHGIMNIGAPSGLQDLTQFNANDGIYNYMAGVDMFTAGTSADTTTGTTVYFYNYDGTRGFDKYQTSMTDPRTAAPSTVVYATVRLYQDSTSNKYMMQITNMINTEPDLDVEVVMTYGGGVYKQRYLTLSASGASMHMLPLQYQASGDDASTDRTRQQYRDYHMDRWYDTTTSLLIAEPAASKSFDINCAACHYTGYQVTQNTTTGEFTATAVEDPNGTKNPVDSGIQQEMNVGCETCHGPGSEHLAASGNGVAIVNPNDLTVSRVTMLCGRCHSRPQGNSSFTGVNTDQPTDTNDEMLHPGDSRANYLANYTNRDDAKDSSMWADGLHSKSHHQQYTDFIQTPKYRNGSQLKTCVDCHGIHAPGTDRHQLSGTSDNTLCVSCHASKTDIVAHMTDKTGTSMGASAQCIQCHFTKNAKSGAGDPIGKVGSAATYRHNDISSHLLTVATKADAVAQQMPVPYTNTCGGCHSLTNPL